MSVGVSITSFGLRFSDMNARVLFAFGLLIFTLSGCAHFGANLPVAGTQRVTSGPVLSGINDSRTAKRLYIGNDCPGSPPVVTMIPLPLISNPTEKNMPIPQSADCAEQIAFHGGFAYIATPLAGVLVYPLPLTPHTQEAFQLGSTFTNDGLAFSRSGNLFVADDGSFVVDVYKPPFSQNSSPAFSFGGSQIMQYQRSFLVDAQNDLYMVNAPYKNVLIYHPPYSKKSVPSVAMTLPNNDFPYVEAFDATGNLYVAGQMSIYVFQPPFTNSSQPVTTISGSQSGLDYPGGLALDAAGNLYVANQSGGTLLEFVPPFGPTSAPIVTVQGLGEMDSVTIH